MRTKQLIWMVIGLIAVAGLWAGRAVWRVHRQLVTLDVRNMPLAEVLRKIERQTWTTIRAAKDLDARITLHLQDKPLAEVLDRLAEQAGAHWANVYAVYDSKAALNRLDGALSSDGKLEPAGWTRLAPNLSAPDLALADQVDPMKAGARFAVGQPAPDLGGGDHGVPGPGPGLVLRGPGGSDGSAPARMEPMATIGGGPSPDGLGPNSRAAVLMRRGPDGPVIFMGGPNGDTELWSPEQLVIESSLKPRLGGQTNQTATAQSATETAREVRGNWTTYIAFTKSVMGVGFAGAPRPGMDPLHRNPNDRFARLTPEQRVQQARQRLPQE